MHCGASLGLARLPGSARPARPPRQLAGGPLSARHRATQLRLLSRRQPAASVECRARVAEQAWEGEWDSDEEDSDDEIEYDSDGEEVERPFGPPVRRQRAGGRASRACFHATTVSAVRCLRVTDSSLIKFAPPVGCRH